MPCINLHIPVELSTKLEMISKRKGWYRSKSDNILKILEEHPMIKDMVIPKNV